MDWHYAPPSRVVARPTRASGHVIRYVEPAGYVFLRYRTPDDFSRQTSHPSLLDRIHTALAAGVVIGMLALCLVVLLRGLS